MDRSECAKVFSYVMAEHGVHLTDDLFAVWFDQFHHLDFETAMRAARLLVSSKSFGTPKCSDMHEALAKLEQSACSNEEAWEEILKVVGTCGRYQKARALNELSKIDPVIAEAADSIYLEICNAENDQLPAVRAHFWKVLTAKRARKNALNAGLLPETKRISGFEKVSDILPGVMKRLEGLE